MTSIVTKLVSFLPKDWQATAKLRLFGLVKVPLIYYTRPYIVEESSQRCEVVIPLNRRTKNHWDSMYFGTLAVGVDVAGGWLAMRKAVEAKQPVSLLFKGVNIDFKRRAEGDVHFVCEDGDKIAEAIQETIRTGERVNLPVRVIASVPSKNEPCVMEATQILSLKRSEAGRSEAFSD